MKRTETDENDFLGVEHSRTKFSLKSNEFAWHLELNFCRKIHNAFDIVDVISWPWTIIAHCPVAQVYRLFIYGRCWSGYSYQMVSIKPIMWLAHKEEERMCGAGGCSVLTFLAMHVFTVYRLPVPCTYSIAGGLHSINRRMLLRLHTFVQCQCTRTKVHCNKWANTCVVRVRVVYAVKSVHRCESDGRKDKCFSFVSYQLQWPIHKAKQTMATTTWRYKLELPVISHTQFGCHYSYRTV